MGLSLVNNTAVLTPPNRAVRIAEPLGRLSKAPPLNRNTESPVSLGISERTLSQISTLQAAVHRSHQAIAAGKADLNTLSQTLANNANTFRASVAKAVSNAPAIRDEEYAHEVAVATQEQLRVAAGFTVLSNSNQTSQLLANLAQE